MNAPELMGAVGMAGTVAGSVGFALWRIGIWVGKLTSELHSLRITIERHITSVERRLDDHEKRIRKHENKLYVQAGGQV